MRKFKRLRIVENLPQEKQPDPYPKKGSEYLRQTPYAGRWIIDTSHSVDRFHERYPKISQSTVLDVIQRGIKLILGAYKDRAVQYGIHSHSTGIGVLIDWRPDKGDPKDLRNHAVIITLLPVKKSHTFQKGTIPLMVEARTTPSLRASLREWVRERAPEALKEKRNTAECVSDQNLQVTLWEGDIYDTNIAHWLIVD